MVNTVFIIGMFYNIIIVKIAGREKVKMGDDFSSARSRRGSFHSTQYFIMNEVNY